MLLLVLVLLDSDSETDFNPYELDDSKWDENFDASKVYIEPKAFVNELVNDAINKLSDKSLTIEEKSKYIEKVALENVDIKALSLYTLGELRKTAKKIGRAHV